MALVSVDVCDISVGVMFDKGNPEVRITLPGRYPDDTLTCAMSQFQAEELSKLLLALSRVNRTVENV
jgi:hypothetical protein